MTAQQILETRWSVNKMVCVRSVSTDTQPQGLRSSILGRGHSISKSCEAAVAQLIPALRSKCGLQLIKNKRKTGYNVLTPTVARQPFYTNVCKLYKNTQTVDDVASGFSLLLFNSLCWWRAILPVIQHAGCCIESSPQDTKYGGEFSLFLHCYDGSPHSFNTLLHL